MRSEKIQLDILPNNRSSLSKKTILQKKSETFIGNINNVILKFHDFPYLIFFEKIR